jgi:hypothetical protein
MTTSSLNVHLISIASLSGLVAYTLVLLRTGRLSPHLAVRWVLAECAAIVAVLLWRWLPFFRFTSAMDDRELLLVLAVIFFVLIVFLMLDSLARISTHNVQIKRLTQELALLQAQLEKTLRPEKLSPVVAEDAGETVSAGSDQSEAATIRPRSSWGIETALSLWVTFVVGMYIWETQSTFPNVLQALLTAEYLK